MAEDTMPDIRLFKSQGKAALLAMPNVADVSVAGDVIEPASFCITLQCGHEFGTIRPKDMDELMLKFGDGECSQCGVPATT